MNYVCFSCPQHQSQYSLPPWTSLPIHFILGIYSQVFPPLPFPPSSPTSIWSLSWCSYTLNNSCATIRHVFEWILLIDKDLHKVRMSQQFLFLLLNMLVSCLLFLFLLYLYFCTFFSCDLINQFWKKFTDVKELKNPNTFTYL